MVGYVALSEESALQLCGLSQWRALPINVESVRSVPEDRVGLIHDPAHTEICRHLRNKGRRILLMSRQAGGFASMPGDAMAIRAFCFTRSMAFVFSVRCDPCQGRVNLLAKHVVATAPCGTGSSSVFGPVCFDWWAELLLVISLRQSMFSEELTRLKKNGHVTCRRTRPCRSTHSHLLTLSATGPPLPPSMEFRKRWSGVGVPCQRPQAWALSIATTSLNQRLS